mmetsp:Transcript_2703/g.3939  ORF Transcript_2703/g.3939 Transcript_2703/m.3939 type:complete len:245 (+) Transcript_2703:130-864(+)
MKLRRILHETYCWISLLVIFPSYYYGGIPLFILQTILGGGVACLMDWFVSPTMKKNVARIEEKGLDDQKGVLIGMYLTIITSESILVGLAVLSSCFESTPYFNSKLVFRVAASIAFNEVLFTLVHRYFLHGTKLGASVHAQHHCCRPSTFSSSFIFNFWDSNTEFSLTHVGMTIFHNSLFHDPFSLLVTLQITYLWYTVVGHSENLKCGHYFHHQYVNSNYSSYTNFVRFRGRDYVKDLVLQKA